MFELDLTRFEKMPEDKAFRMLLFLYGEIASNTEDLKHKALEFASESIVKAYTDMEQNKLNVRNELCRMFDDLMSDRRDYKSYYERITALPDCMTCDNKSTCEYCPDVNDYSRINCPLFKKKGDTK